MKPSRNLLHDALHWLCVGLLLLSVSTAAVAHLRLSSDWRPSILPNGDLVPDALNEGKQLDKIALDRLTARTATPDKTRSWSLALAFKLFIDDTLFYLQPMLFMPQSHPGERCTDVAQELAYRCKEGPRHTQACHVGLFDARFREVGWHTIRIDEAAPLFCNAVPAVGVANADRNELLVTVQYFFIDGKHATKVSEIGSGWKRMTVLLRLDAGRERIRIEQDDRCLGNPNRIDTVPDARKALKRCEATSAR